MTARLLVHVQPRARRTAVAGRHGDAIKIRLAAPPVDNAANEELVRFLAETLGVPRTFIAATLLGALGQSLFGFTGMLLGSIAGLIVGWWAARRLLPR